MKTLLLCTGPPLVPYPRLHVLSATELLVSWDEPFTWEEYPIIDYNITVYNICDINSEVYTNMVVTECSKFVALNQEMTTCSLLRFEVSARNKLGSSGKGIISGGFPGKSLHNKLGYI